MSLVIFRNFEILESSPSCFSNPCLDLGELMLEEGEEVVVWVEDMSMFRIEIYPGASDEGGGGGFTFKHIHIFKGNMSLWFI